MTVANEIEGVRLRVEGFGPVERAELDLRPFTVLVGPNNSGKSSLTQLIYLSARILNRIACDLTCTYVRPFFEKYLTRVGDVRKGFIKYFGDVSRYVTEAWLRQYFVNIERLINFKRDKAVVNISTNSIEINIDIGDGIYVDVKLKDSFVGVIDEVLAAVRLPERALSEIARRLRRRWVMAYYLPAERAGLMESLDVVVGAIFEEPQKVEKALSGFILEFYRDWTHMRWRLEKPYAGAYAEEVDVWFRGVMGGSVRLERHAGIQRLVFEVEGGGGIDLLHASSAVKELVPIYFALKAAPKKALIIIDEPEAHLHPATQVRLVELLARLVGKGLRIAVATHSDIVLWKLANLVDGKMLPAESVAIYRMRPGAYGYVAELLSIDNIFQEYYEVVAQLYEESWNYVLSK